MTALASTAESMRAIAAECRRAGLTVAAVPGWETRGLGPLRPEWVVCHHTAAPGDVDNLLLNGRADLRGPLCNFALHRGGTVVLMAAGRANHAGKGVVGSSESYGIEATGPVPITATGAKAFPNYDAYIKLVAAIRRVHGWGSDHVVAHKEIARPVGRKVDPFFDMDTFRAQVSMQLTRPTALKEDELPLTTEERDWLRKLDTDTRKFVKQVVLDMEERITARLDRLTLTTTDPEDTK